MFFLNLTPKFPVVDPNPSFSKCVDNISESDYMAMSIYTLVGTAVGAIIGARHKAHGPMYGVTLFTATSLGLFAGACYALQTSSARLTGHSENKDEVKKFGVYSEA